MICRKLHILSNSAKFSAGRPVLPAYNFSATMSSTEHLSFGAVVSLKLSATQTMPPISVLYYLHSPTVLFTNIKFRSGTHTICKWHSADRACRCLLYSCWQWWFGFRRSRISLPTS